MRIKWSKNKHIVRKKRIKLKKNNNNKKKKEKKEI